MNAKGTALRRHYGKLEPLERFRLVTAALRSARTATRLG